MDDADDDVLEEDPEEDDWLQQQKEELGFCPICGEDWCRSAH